MKSLPLFLIVMGAALAACFFGCFGCGCRPNPAAPPGGAAENAPGDPPARDREPQAEEATVPLAPDAAPSPEPTEPPTPLEPPAESQVVIEWVTVGNPGNRPDRYGLGHGAVDYAYRIGKYEVTNGQYAAFLNAVAWREDRYLLYHENMDLDPEGGIQRKFVDREWIYTVKPGMKKLPVNYVNFYSALRFINWLHNGQGNGDTEKGAYTLEGNQLEPLNSHAIRRVADAKYWLPNEDEWYKAAYYDATKGEEGGYWRFPTRSDELPAAVFFDEMATHVPGDGPGANYWSHWTTNFLLEVGFCGEASASYYGTFDQGGNVDEWNETLVAETYRSVRGGSSRGRAFEMTAPARGEFDPNVTWGHIGFRVAGWPKGSEASMMGGGFPRGRSLR